MRFSLLKSLAKNLSVFMMALSLLACAHAQTYSPSEDDPLEPLNRQLFSFHKWADERFFKPIALSYRAIVPPAVRKGVNNVFANVDEIPITVNNVLQGEFKRAGGSTRRFVINTIFGVAGIFDVAGDMGYIRERSDFGQTLYHWGWKQSSYIFVPLFGPTTIRDGIGVVADVYMMPWPYLEENIEWAAFGIFAVNQRAKFLDTEVLLSVAALDEYSFLRDGYLANRKIFVKQEPLSHLDETQEDWGDIL